MTRPHGYEIEDLRVFCEVERRGSFTGAATALHYTQSGVSRRIGALERATGGPLFVRRARGVSLTPVGAVLHRHALDILGRLDAATADLDAVRHGRGGRLRIGSFATANAVLVPSALARFRERWSGVETSVVEALTRRLVDWLHAGEIDMAVVSDYPSGVMAAEGLDLAYLCDDPLLVALPAGHPLAGEPVVDLGDLADESWIEAGRHREASVLAVAAARAGFTPRTDITVPGWTAKQGFVAAGLGVTLVPRLAAEAMRPDIVLRPVRDLPTRRVFVALPAGAGHLAAATHFAELLTEEVTFLPGVTAGVGGQRGSP
jgi:DNA-binding transcriptional LysR family regulator